MKLCEEYAEGYKPIKGWTKEKQIKEDMERLANAIGTAQAIANFPKRLGPDSTQYERKVDKKRGNALAWVFRNAAKNWTRLFDVTPTIKRASEYRANAAQLNWPAWHEDWIAELIERRGRVCASCVKMGDKRLGNLFAKCYDWEIAQVDGACVRHGIDAN